MASSFSYPSGFFPDFVPSDDTEPSRIDYESASPILLSPMSCSNKQEGEYI